MAYRSNTPVADDIRLFEYLHGNHRPTSYEARVKIDEEIMAENARIERRRKLNEEWIERRKKPFDIPGFEFYEYEKITRERENRTYKPHRKLNLPDETYLQFYTSSLHPIEGFFKLVIPGETEFKKKITESGGIHGSIALNRNHPLYGNSEDLTLESQERLEMVIYDLVKSVPVYFEEKRRKQKALDNERREIEEGMLQELFKNIPDFELIDVTKRDYEKLQLTYKPKREMVRFPEDEDVYLYIYTSIYTKLNNRGKDIQIRIYRKHEISVFNTYFVNQNWNWEQFWRCGNSFNYNIIQFARASNDEMSRRDRSLLSFESYKRR